ncbi:zinc-binding dehydrogenase [Streptomyces marokkonensis]|uniref:zinc-binding dehydrogenase n=1 Tax=Streptomyces marokkonensis TaxID=324855 RepID=UPI0031F1BAEA
MNASSAAATITDKARLAPGERLLVRGATGGVGSVAVQFGDAALDYRTTRPEDLGRFDVVVDVVGTDLGAYRARLDRRGRMVALAFDPDRIVMSMVGTGLRAALRPRRSKLFSNNPSAERMAELTRCVERGDIRPVIHAVLPMDDVAEAHRRLEAGGVRGKYVVDMGRP